MILRRTPRPAPPAALAVFLAAALAACSGEREETGESAAPPKLTPSELAQIHERGDYTFLDVRSAEEIRELGTLPGYLHIPIDELEDRLAEIPPDKPIVAA